MIYDTVMFLNELDLLEIRLNILNDVVDKFIISECDTTHRGESKPFYYEENKDRFSSFSDKIIYLKNEIKQGGDPWVMEYHQRDIAFENLDQSFTSDDWIIFSDIDEIPVPSKISAVSAGAYTPKDSGIFVFENYHHIYFVNSLFVWEGDINKKWYGSRMIKYQDMNSKEYTPSDIRGYSGHELKSFGPPQDPNSKNVTLVPDAGNHFSWLGSSSDRVLKYKSIALTKEQTDFGIDLNDQDLELKINASVNNEAYDLYADNPGLSIKKIEMDSDIIPDYIKNNSSKYSDLIKT